jgi:hypothetical protein
MAGLERENIIGDRSPDRRVEEMPEAVKQDVLLFPDNL